MTGRSWWAGPAESFGVLTIARVPAATSAQGVLPWAPLVGLVLGALACAVGWVGARSATPLVGAVLAVMTLAVLTRGLHLDGLADTADGLGPLRGRERALAVMRSGDVGPFGVATLVLTLLLQTACLAALLDAPGGWSALLVAVVAARLAMARTGLPGVPTAEGSSLGRAVAGTVSRGWLVGTLVLTAGAVLGGAALQEGGIPLGLALIGAAVAGLVAAEALFARARDRLGGVTGDVMGAMGEIATAAALLAAVVLLR
jgi:adenosylcobinamide-GDP ribazoletransferase